jgi:hypothetical protein
MYIIKNVFLAKLVVKSFKTLTLKKHAYLILWDGGSIR